MLILILPKIYEFYSTLTHMAGVVGNVFFQYPWEPVFTVTCQIFFTILHYNFWQLLGHFPAQNLADLFILFFAYFNFFSDIKRVQYRTRINVLLNYVFECFCKTKAILKGSVKFSGKIKWISTDHLPR